MSALGEIVVGNEQEFEIMPRLVFIDQNAWVALARGSWDKVAFPKEHAALTRILEAVRFESIVVPLTFANFYETSKINDPIRRANMARVQTLISGGRVFRSRRRILEETLVAYIADKLSIPRAAPEKYWFLSDLWFEAAADYSPEKYGFELSPRVLDFFRRDPAYALYRFFCFDDESARAEAVRRFSSASAELIARIEARRAIAAGESLAMRKRLYSAQLIIDELDFILATGRQLGLNWRSVGDVGASLTRGLATEVAILNVERELAVRLEDQLRNIHENDLRDMASFTIALPFADIMIAEKPFVNLARQAHLDKAFGTKLLTSVFDF
jgi:hypothetical protein